MINIRPRTLLAVLLLGALTLSIIGNIVFFSYGKRFYIEHAMVRLDPLGLDYFSASDNRPSDSGKPVVVLLGDSRVAAWPHPSLAAATIINRGVYSQTSAQVALRYEAHVAPLNPDIVVLQVGVNDLKTLGVLPTIRDHLVARCIANIDRIIESARRQNAHIIVSTIFPVGRAALPKKPFWHADIARAVEEVNAHLRALQRDGVVLFDAWRILADENGLLRREFAPDELHLNAAGYTTLNRHLTVQLQETLTVDTKPRPMQ
jgi:lysophospholipase L1-like esterase